MEEVIRYLKGLMLLQLQAQTEGAAFSKPELLLERAGFSAREIAEFLGKNEGAVAKTIQRAKAGMRGGNS